MAITLPTKERVTLWMRPVLGLATTLTAAYWSVTSIFSSKKFEPELWALTLKFGIDAAYFAQDIQIVANMPWERRIREPVAPLNQIVPEEPIAVQRHAPIPIENIPAQRHPLEPLNEVRVDSVVLERTAQAAVGRVT